MRHSAYRSNGGSNRTRVTGTSNDARVGELRALHRLSCAHLPYECEGHAPRGKWTEGSVECRDFRCVDSGQMTTDWRRRKEKGSPKPPVRRLRTYPRFLFASRLQFDLLRFRNLRSACGRAVMDTRRAHRYLRYSRFAASATATPTSTDVPQKATHALPFTLMSLWLFVSPEAPSRHLHFGTSLITLCSACAMAVWTALRTNFLRLPFLCMDIAVSFPAQRPLARLAGWRGPGHAAALVSLYTSA